MSTRCNIKLVEGEEHQVLWLYRHSDGYPEMMVPILQRFCDEVNEGHFRNNISQSAGWLIVWGHEEYAPSRELHPDFYGWKVGSFEPTPYGRHGDIEYLYEIQFHPGTDYLGGVAGTATLRAFQAGWDGPDTEIDITPYLPKAYTAVEAQ